ncbi:hypothetical protein QOZ80_2BG0190930 [Eleusine coracana subsp. coracana]|nr:hypothetical protein QOZ80_2BG0190930 [Eleusine coracana subsp. coracana]
MEAPPAWLPLDLIVQVLTHSDPVTIARAAATCKSVRGRVAGSDFRARLLRSAGADRFVVGIFYRQRTPWEKAVPPVRVSPLITPARPPNERPPIPVASFMSRNTTTDLFASHRLVASRDGLLALAPKRRAGEGHHQLMCVCDAVTGNRVSFPPPETPLVSGHLYVLLPLDDNNLLRLSSFKLLFADTYLSTQTFSSAERRWGPVTSNPDLPLHRHDTELAQRFPVVVGGVAYWLHKQILSKRGPFHVVALDVRTGRGRSFEVPHYCLRRLAATFAYKDLHLARGPADEEGGGGKLILVVAEDNAFSAWTVPDDAEEGGRWTRSVLIDRAAILRSVTPLLPNNPLGCQSLAFEWFGERTSTIVLQMHGVGMLVWNLRTKQIHQLESSMSEYEFDILCPYELDLESLFTAHI